MQSYTPPPWIKENGYSYIIINFYFLNYSNNHILLIYQEQLKNACMYPYGSLKNHSGCACYKSDQAMSNLLLK